METIPVPDNQESAAEKAWELRRQAESARREELINRNLQQSGLSREAWLSLTFDQRQRLERGWHRAEQQSPEWMLEQKLNSLIGRKVTSFDVGEFGEIELAFDDGFILSFQSWNMRNDAPDYDAVNVRKKELPQSG